MAGPGVTPFELGGWPSGKTYQVVVVFPDGNPEVASYWGNLDQAFAEATKLRAQLAVGGGQFFVGVVDEDDPERGWLQPNE